MRVGGCDDYLFIRKKADIAEYRKRFDRTKAALENKETPVFCEMASARTNLAETLPYHIVNGGMLIAGTLFLQRFSMNPVVSMAVVMVVNNLCGAVANYVFTCIKHRLRMRLCGRLGVPAEDHSIAVMESMEYQSF